MSQISKEINQPSTSSDTDVCSIISSVTSNCSNNSEHEENASSSKKCKLNTTIFESNEVISKEV